MLRSDLKSIRDELKGIDELREKIIKIVRIIVRLSGSSITQIHRSEFKKANKTILEAERWIKKLNESLEDKPSIKHNGNLQVAFQEYVEAKLLYSIATNRKLISFKLLKVDPIPYILGLLDLVGELRRMVLNLLHEGKIRDAERMLSLMESIYDDLISLEHTHFIQAFRRKLDVARRLIEITRGDLINEASKISLERAIGELKNSVMKKA